MCVRQQLEDEAADAAVDDLPLIALVDALVEALIHVQPELLWTPVHRCVPASDANMEMVVGPASIWDVALLAARPEPQLDLFGDIEHAPPAAAPEPVQAAPQHPTVDTVSRLRGRTVVRGLAYPDNRWTAEKAEKERARRARQIVPKPSAAARVFRVGKES